MSHETWEMRKHAVKQMVETASQINTTYDANVL